MDDVPSRIAIQVILMIVFALAAGAEAALSVIDKAEPESGESPGNRLAHSLVGRWIGSEHSSMHAFRLAQIVSISLAGLFLMQYSAPVILSGLTAQGLAPGLGMAIVFLALLLLMILEFGLVGWLLVRRYCLHREWKFLNLWALPCHLIRLFFLPVAVVVTAIGDGWLRVIGIRNVDETETVTEEEIRALVDLGSENGSIDDQEREVIQNVLELDNYTAEDAMTHRTDMQVLWMDDSLEVWEKSIEEADHSRLPVCGEDVDDVVGILFIKDFYIAVARGARTTQDLKPLLRDAYFVPESVRVDQLLRDMQKDHIQFAVVIDEYGGVSGILTFHDLLEKLVGDISDNWGEDEEEDPDIIRLDDATWRIRGTTPLEDVSRALEIDLPEEENDTLGGMIFNALDDTIPDDGEQLEPIEVNGLRIEVEQIQAHRIEWARVQKLTAETEPETEE